MYYTLLFDRKQRVLLVRFGNLLSEPALVSMRKTVGNFIAKEGSCRALVAPKPEIFGLSRMYELNQDSTEGNTIVARTRQAACEALGAHALALEEVAS